jgi:hypothetical protein
MLLHKKKSFWIMHCHVPLPSAFCGFCYSSTQRTSRPHMLVPSLIIRNLRHLLLTNSMELSCLEFRISTVFTGLPILSQVVQCFQRKPTEFSADWSIDWRVNGMPASIFTGAILTVSNLSPHNDPLRRSADANLVLTWHFVICNLF